MTDGTEYAPSILCQKASDSVTQFYRGANRSIGDREGFVRHVREQKVSAGDECFHFVHALKLRVEVRAEEIGILVGTAACDLNGPVATHQLVRCNN